MCRPLLVFVACIKGLQSISIPLNVSLESRPLALLDQTFEAKMRPTEFSWPKTSSQHCLAETHYQCFELGSLGQPKFRGVADLFSSSSLRELGLSA